MSEYFLIGDKKFVPEGEPVIQPPTVPAPSGVYRVRKWGDPIMVAEADADVGAVNTTNFQAVGIYAKTAGEFGGVTQFCRIPRADVMRLAALQVEDEYQDKVSDWRDQKMRWLIKPRGTIYFGIQTGETWKTFTKEYIEWGTIALGWNFVTVEDVETLSVKVPGEDSPRKRDMARLAGFRKTDWARPLAELLAVGLVHRCYCAYWGNNIGDTPKGIIYSPFWSPKDWLFIGPAKQQPEAFYLPMDWLIKESA
jgi:hypothetical protein